MRLVNALDTAQVIALIAGVVIPFVVALLAKAHASAPVMSILALVTAGLVALGTYLGDASGGHTLKGALSVFVLALVSAAVSRKTVTDPAPAKLQAATPGLVGAAVPGNLRQP